MRNYLGFLQIAGVTIAVTDHTGLTSELCTWLSVRFNEHTMAAFMFKCMEEPTFGSPTAHPLDTESMILVRPGKSV